MRIVHNMPTYSYEDMFQIASMGFLEACDTYDKNKGTFISYASNIMNWYVSNSLRTKRTTVKYPQYFQEIWRIASKNKLTAQKDIDKLVDIVCYTREQVVNAMKWYSSIVPYSLDSQVSNNDDDTSREMYEVIAGEVFDETVAVVNEYKESLTNKQREVMELLLEGKTQSEIADELGVSQATIHRIVKSLQKAWLDTYE